MIMKKPARKLHILDKTPKRLPGTSFRGWASRVRPFICSGQGWQTFPLKGQIINILGFATHTISVLTTRLSHTGNTCVYIFIMSWLCSSKTLSTDTEIWIS